MAHESRNENVLWYIDSIKQSGAFYDVKGWIAHKTSKIIGIRVDDQNIDYVSINRSDVLSLYPYLKDSNVGVEFKISKDDITKPIDIVLTGQNISGTSIGIGTLVHNIGTLEPWLVINSGFNRTDRKSTRLNSSHSQQSRMPSSA